MQYNCTSYHTICLHFPFQRIFLAGKLLFTAITTQCLICYDINAELSNFIYDIFFIFKTIQHVVITK